MCSGTYNSPRNLLKLRESVFRLTRLPSFLGNSPAKKSENVNKTYNARILGHTTNLQSNCCWCWSKSDWQVCRAPWAIYLQNMMESQQNAQTHACWGIRPHLSVDSVAPRAASSWPTAPNRQEGYLLNKFARNFTFFGWQISMIFLRMYDWTYNSPSSLLLRALKTSNFTSLPNSLGNSPAKKSEKCQQTYNQCMLVSTHKAHSPVSPLLDTSILAASLRFMSTSHFELYFPMVHAR